MPRAGAYYLEIGVGDGEARLSWLQHFPPSVVLYQVFECRFAFGSRCLHVFYCACWLSTYFFVLSARQFLFQGVSGIVLIVMASFPVHHDLYLYPLVWAGTRVCWCWCRWLVLWTVLGTTAASLNGILAWHSRKCFVF